MVASFTELRQFIIKCCVSDSSSKDYAQKHHFDLDTAKLNNILVKKEYPYRVVGGTNKLPSYTPYVSDMHSLADFVDTSKDMTEIMDGYSQIILFSLISVEDESGPIELRIDPNAEEAMDTKEIYSALNTPRKLNMELMASVVKDLPVYRIMVVRKFHAKSDSFVYNVYFKSNRRMTEFYKANTADTVSEEKE